MIKEEYLPRELHFLFWDCDLDGLNLNEHRFFIMERVMEQGTWNAMQWLRKNYQEEELLHYLNKKGIRTLPLRELNYWLFICGVSALERDTFLRRRKNGQR